MALHKDEEMAERCEVIDERCYDCPIMAYGCTVCRDMF
jgi:hypothetical protein